MRHPVFTFRLPADQAGNLKAMAKVYGSASTSAFLREMVGATCSGDVGQAQVFLKRLVDRAAGQMVLQFNASLEGAAKGQKRARKPRKERKGVIRAG